jgi:predicted ATPase
VATARVQLLDRIEASVDGERVPVGGPLPRALIARLALERGAPVALDDLIDDLWAEPPAQARTTARAYMSRLRSTPLGPWLEGGRGGYRLVDDPGMQVDLWTLEDAEAGACPPDSEEVRSLLLRWRDSPLQGIGDSPFAAPARMRVRGIVDRVQLLGVRADLDAGDNGRALVALQDLRVSHPDDDDVLALLHTARARADAGDRALARLGGGAVSERDRSRGAHLASNLPAPAGRLFGVPAPIAPMVGRREERAALTAALDVARLVTLTGAAGVGKTRLAVDWLGSDAVAGEDHIWFVNVGDEVDGTVAPAIASAVGAPDAAPEAIAEHLADRRGILVIDGAEGASAGVAAVAVAMLARARGLAVLSTSRRTLGVPGESVLRVDPLSATDAQELFELRLPPATRAADAGAVLQLVDMLGRLPLAIELAAARTAVMPLAEVGDSLLREIDRSEEAGEPRLAAALRSSLALLTSEQRDTLRSVAGFAAPFTRGAAAAVCGERPRDRDLDQLVSFSLVSAEEGEAEPVFRVSPLIRRATLAGEPLDDEWNRRHRAWFASRATEASVALTADGSADVISRLLVEWPDVVAAFDSAVLADDGEAAAAIAGGLLWFGVRAGRQQELLEMVRRASALSAAPSLGAGLSLTRGFLAYQLGQMSEAATWISAARAPAELSGDRALRGLAAAFSAYLYTLSPEPAGDPVAQVAVALADVDEMPDAAAAMILLITGQVHRASGRSRDAIELLGRAGALASRCGHEWVMLMAPVVAAKVQLDLRQGEAAMATLLPAVRRSAAGGDPVSLLIAVSVAAGAAAALGADATGARIIGAVDAIGRRYGFDPRANEPADFELYRRRVREGLTAEEWRRAYASGLLCEMDELVEMTETLVRV